MPEENSVSVLAGATTVLGHLTQFVGFAGDTFNLAGLSVPVAAIVSTSELTLAYGWPGADVTDSLAWLLMPTAPQWSSAVTLHRSVNDLLVKVGGGLPLPINKVGPIARRVLFDNEPEGFLFLEVTDSELDPFRVYAKLSDAPGDWSAGQTIRGDSALSTQAAEAARDLAQAWATHDSGEVSPGEGYSAKFEAGRAAAASADAIAAAGAAGASALATAADRLQTGVDRQQTGVDRVAAADAAGLAQLWATKTDAEVVAGQGYGAKFYADDARSAAADIDATVAIRGVDIGVATASQSVRVPAVVMVISTSGFYAPGDGGGARYRRVASSAYAGKIQTAEGSWWEMERGARNVLAYGAKGDDSTEAQVSIQNAINDQVRDGGGIVYLPAGTYRIGASLEAYPSTYIPNGSSCRLGLVVYSGVVLMGSGRATVLRRGISGPMLVVDCPSGFGTQVRDLMIDGNATEHPYVGDTYGSGGGIGIESNTGAEDRTTIIENVWVRDTPGYGIAVEWGNHRGCTLRNIFIDGTGSDGIDVKRMNAGLFDAYAITLDNIFVTNFGRSATDTAYQAGIDLRGYISATNLHVVGPWGSRAAVGIRMHATGNDVIGANYASVTGFYVERTSGGAAGQNTIGVCNNGAVYGSFANGAVRGCHYNFASYGRAPTYVACRSVGAALIGWAIDAASADGDYISCSDESAGATSFYVAGPRNTFIRPRASGSATGFHALAGSTALIAPQISGVATPYHAASLGNVSVLGHGGIGGINGAAIDADLGVAGASLVRVLRGTTEVTLTPVEGEANVDFNISPKGAGYHMFGNAKLGASAALPANPTGYLKVKIQGLVRRIPYYPDA